MMGIDAQDRVDLLKILAALHGHLEYLKLSGVLGKKAKSRQGLKNLDERIVMAAGES